MVSKPTQRKQISQNVELCPTQNPTQKTTHAVRNESRQETRQVTRQPLQKQKVRFWKRNRQVLPQGDVWQHTQLCETTRFTPREEKFFFL